MAVSKPPPSKFLLLPTFYQRSPPSILPTPRPDTATKAGSAGAEDIQNPAESEGPKRKPKPSP